MEGSDLNIAVKRDESVLSNTDKRMHSEPPSGEDVEVTCQKDQCVPNNFKSNDLRDHEEYHVSGGPLNATKPVNVQDLLNCILPRSPLAVHQYLEEVKKRASICVERYQIESALSILAHGIACAVLNPPTQQERWLRELYILFYEALLVDSSFVSKCDLLYTLKKMIVYNDDFEVTDYILRKLYGSGLSEAKLKKLKDNIHDQSDSESENDPSLIVDAQKNIMSNSSGDNSADDQVNYSVMSQGVHKDCNNCHRVNAYWESSKEDLYFDLYSTYPDNLKGVRNGLRFVSVTKNRDCCDECQLCSECHLFLWREKGYSRASSWCDMWPSFYWSLLSSAGSSLHGDSTQTYGGDYLWRMIPNELRRFWRGTLAVFMLDQYPFVMVGSKEREPESYFRDITSSLSTFRDNISECTYESLLTVLEPSRVGKNYETERPFIIPDVLCPWGCSEFCFAAAGMNPAILLQHILARVELKMDPSWIDKLHTAETMRLDYFRHDGEDVDKVLLNKDWPILPSMMFVRGEGMMVCTCRHHAKSDSRKRLYCHPPRKSQNLSSIHADQLAPVTVQQKIARSVVRRGVNTTPTSSYSNMSYAGFCTADVAIGGRFAPKNSEYMNNIHEVTSLCRVDISNLLNAYVSNGIVTPQLADSIRREHNVECTPDIVNRLIRGSSYTPTLNALELQKAASVGNEIIVVVEHKTAKSRRGDGIPHEKQVNIPRTWCKMIYNVQVVDGLGFGCRMKACAHISSSRHKAVSSLAWCLLASVGSTKELYHLVDEKTSCHSYKNFSGYLLTYIHNSMMRHCDFIHSRNSPFAGCDANDLCRLLDSNLQDIILDSSSVDVVRYEVFNSLFNDSEYPNIKVLSDLSQDVNITQDRVLIVVSDVPPVSSAHVDICDSESRETARYEARSVVVVSDDEKTSGYSGVRYCRHGDGHKRWWFQGKHSRVMVQSDHSDDEDVFPPIDNYTSETRFVTVYVRDIEIDVERYRIDLHKSVGGQDMLFCGCEGSRYSNPLILTGACHGEKKVCSCSGCTKKEKYICQKCKLCLCGGCFKRLGELDKRTTINMSDLENISEVNDNDCEVNDDDENSLHSNSTCDVQQPPEKRVCLDGLGDEGMEYIDPTYIDYDTEPEDDIPPLLPRKEDMINDNVSKFEVNDDDGIFYKPIHRLVSTIATFYILVDYLIADIS